MFTSIRYRTVAVVTLATVAGSFLLTAVPVDAQPVPIPDDSSVSGGPVLPGSTPSPRH